MLIDRGDYLFSDVNVVNVENVLHPLRALKVGSNALIALFVPYCFGDDKEKNSIHALIRDVSENINIFKQRSLRLICITRFLIDLTLNFLI